jgi:hypothetical protein
MFLVARLGGIEPPHPAPEAGALSPELQAPFPDRKEMG